MCYLKKIVVSLVFVIVCYPVLQIAVFAQENLATLDGTVADDKGDILPGANIFVKSAETGYEYSTVARSNGRYIISGILPQKYDITVSMPGFVSQVKRGLILNIAAKYTIDFKLSVSTIEIDIEVTAEAPLVEVTKSEISSVVDRRKIDDLPLLDRNFASLSVLKAGVQDNRSGGQPEGSEEYIIDGVSNEHNTRNTIRENIPADAIQEFRIITNQYAAEYGNASGMIMNAITRSGTNEFKGRISGFLRDEAFDAKNYFADDKGKFSQYRFGGFLGGPIIKDRMHFFLNYEGYRHTEYGVVTSPLVPRESIPIKYRNDQFLIKTDFRLDEKNIFSFRYTRDWPRSDNETVGGLRTRERAQSIDFLEDTFVGNWSYFPSDNTMNEIRLQYARSNRDYRVPDPNSYTINRPSGYFGKDPWAPQGFKESRYQIIDNFSIFLNKHNIKVGFDLNFLHLFDTWLYQYVPGEFDFTTDEPFNPNNGDTYPFLFIYIPEIIRLDVPVRNYGFFVQDSWKVHPRFTLNLGLRYNYYFVESMHLNNFSPKSFNPRLGFSWDPIGDGKTSIRGGIGTFTNNIMTNAPLSEIVFKDLEIRVILFPGYPDPFQPNPYMPGESFQLPMDIYINKAKDQIAPYTLQTTLGFQRQVLQEFSISADLVWTKGYRLLRVDNLNPVIEGTYYIHKDPTQPNIWVMGDFGKSDYKGLYLNINKRYSNGWSVDVSYALSRSVANVETEQNEPSNYTNPELDYGPTLTDARHRLTASGILDLPLGFQLSAIFYYRSATPYNIILGYDANQDSINMDYPPGKKRNSGRGSDVYYLNARISKFIKIDRYRLQVFVEMFNVANRANFASYVGNMQSTEFGKPQVALDPRLIQVGARFDF